MLTRVSNFISYIEEDDTAINNEDKREFKFKKMLKFTQFCNF